MAIGLTSSARGRRRRGGAPMAEINVTPMVDVMLVLLIVFMVAAPLLTAGVPVDLPGGRAAALQRDQKPLGVSVDKAGRVFIGTDPVADGALAARLTTLRADKGPDARVEIRADRHLDYGRVMHVMGELSRAGFTHLALVSTPDAEAAR